MHLIWRPCCGQCETCWTAIGMELADRYWISVSCCWIRKEWLLKHNKVDFINGEQERAERTTIVRTPTSNSTAWEMKIKISQRKKNMTRSTVTKIDYACPSNLFSSFTCEKISHRQSPYVEFNGNFSIFGGINGLLITWTLNEEASCSTGRKYGAIYRSNSQEEERRQEHESSMENKDSWPQQ